MTVLNLERPRSRVQKPRKRADAKVYQRAAIIEAALDCIAEHGISGTTVSRIVARAGIARGMVNLYFGSKDALLLESLKASHAAYYDRIGAALAVDAAPGEQIRAYIETDLGPEVLNERAMAIWFAFRGEAKSHPEYAPFVDSRDLQLETRLSGIILAMLPLGRGARSAAGELARGLMLLLEGAWTDYHLNAATFDRDITRRVCTHFVERAVAGASR